MLAGESHLMCQRGVRVPIIPVGAQVFSTCVMSLHTQVCLTSGALQAMGHLVSQTRF